MGFGQSTCPVGANCINGACCTLASLPLCANGARPTAFCTQPGTQSTCGTGYQCVAFGCCANTTVATSFNLNVRPTCPNGQPATQPCDQNNPCPNPGIQTCIKGACCNQQRQPCPGGVTPVGGCSGMQPCQPGMLCTENQCCPASCPNGQFAIQVICESFLYFEGH